jgi:hypothetical protein
MLDDVGHGLLKRQGQLEDDIADHPALAATSLDPIVQAGNFGDVGCDIEAVGRHVASYPAPVPKPSVIAVMHPHMGQYVSRRLQFRRWRCCFAEPRSPNSAAAQR